MALDKNYSTINKQKKIFDVVEANFDTPRTIVKIAPAEYAAGITAGDVIRYDTVSLEYVRSLASSSSYNAEVFGIVESMDSDSNLNVVTNGSINLPSNHLINFVGSNSGRDDIYFLSDTIPGYLQNSGPTLSNTIIKPIYQVAPHGEYTGVVKNYLGYLNPDTSFNTNSQNLLNLNILRFSNDFTKILTYQTEYETFVIKSTTFNSNTQILDTTQIKVFNTSDIVIDPGLDSIVFPDVFLNRDARISNDGNHILLYNKFTNKIYYIFIDENTPRLKSIIDVDIDGSVSDKLWDADDELTSFVISSRATTRLKDETIDTRTTANSVCSKIEYYKRSVNNKLNPYRWKKCHTNHATGFIKSSPVIPTINPKDSFLISGIFRTSDIKCNGKNYGTVSFSLKQDQDDYSSRESNYQSQRYTDITDKPPLYLYDQLRGISGSTITIEQQVSSDEYFIRNYIRPTRTYDLVPNVNNFYIHKKIDNYYYEDFSYKTFYGFSPSMPYLSSLGFSSPFASIASFDMLTTFGSLVVSPGATTPKETLCSKIYLTENFTVTAYLFYFYPTNTKKILITKFPFYSEDEKTPFRYFEYSVNSATDIPSTTGSGFTKYFTSSDISDILNVTYFEFFGNDDRFFLCTPTYVIVYDYGTSSFSRINTQVDFTKSYFYSNSDGDFFVVEDRIFKYINSPESISQISVLLT